MAFILRCSDCEGREDRPGLMGCTSPVHPAPTLAERIARVIEADICDRRGLKQAMEQVDPDTQDDIRDKWVYLIQEELKK